MEASLAAEHPMPQILGDYELIERVARGGMASLYLARRAGPRGFIRPVALKVVHPHLTEDSDFVEMFIDEANVCSRLNHPNVVHVEELGESDGQLFLVMEFVDGCSLGQILNMSRARDMPLSPGVVVYIVAEIAEGLHSAHELRGDQNEPLALVHRDVSPSNILLSRQGQPKIIDFGIAKFATRQHQTRTQQVKGKLAYMSPEQLRREPLDRRSDIYALGMVLWESLANRRAYAAKGEVDLLKQVMKGPPPSIETVRPGLSPALVAALQRALSPEPKHRFDTVLQFADALKDAVPEVGAVTRKTVAELVKRVQAHKGDAITSFERIRTPSASWALDASDEEAPEATEARDTRLTLDAHTMGSQNGRRGHRVQTLIMGGLVMTAVGLAVGTLASSWFRETPISIEPGDISSVVPQPRTPKDDAAAKSEPMPEQSDRVEGAILPPTPELPRDSTAPADVQTQTAESVEPTERPPRRRIRRRPKAEASSTEATGAGLLSPEERPSRDPTRAVRRRSGADREDALQVDGVRLASPAEVDRANLQRRKRSSAKKVREDDAVLADDYQ